LSANGCALAGAEDPSGASLTGGGGQADGPSVGYQPSEAVAYADGHWDDGQGLCAEFTSRSLQAGSLDIDVVPYVPTLLAALEGGPYEEHNQGDSPTATAGDVVIYSDGNGSDFCDDASNDEYNCGHACIVATGGTGETTITIDCHNNAHYHLGLGYILGTGYSTYRIYHLAPPQS